MRYANLALAFSVLAFSLILFGGGITGMAIGANEQIPQILPVAGGLLMLGALYCHS